MNWTRTRAIAFDTWRAQASSVWFWLMLGLTTFATLTINPSAMLPGGGAFASGTLHDNSMMALAQSFSLAGVVFYSMLIPVIAGTALLRDDDARMLELIHATPMSAADYLVGKWIGTFGTIVIVVTWHVMVMIAWQQAGPMLGAGVTQGSFSLLNYLVPMVLFVLFGAVWCATSAQVLMEYSRSTMALYRFAAAVFGTSLAGLMAGTQVGESFGSTVFDAADIWGARWLSTQVLTGDQSIDWINETAIRPDSGFLMSRLGLAVAAAIGFFLRSGIGRAQSAAQTTKSGSVQHRSAVPPMLLQQQHRQRDHSNHCPWWQQQLPYGAALG
ncbi:MAG: hypothetical protein IPK97_05710 [Ahniella sp.]|nr:hypothetical protein [Ahniella sp.]